MPPEPTPTLATPGTPTFKPLLPDPPPLPEPLPEPSLLPVPEVDPPLPEPPLSLLAPEPLLEVEPPPPEPSLLDPPPEPLPLPEADGEAEADGVVAAGLAAGVLALAEADGVAAAVGEDAALSVRDVADEGDDAGGAVVEGTVAEGAVLAGFAWAGWCVEWILSDGAPACAPLLTMTGAPTTAVRGPEAMSLALTCAAGCPWVAQAAAPVATATVPTAATLNDVRASIPDSASCLGKPSAPNAMRRPRILFQRSLAFCCEVIW